MAERAARLGDLGASGAGVAVVHQIHEREGGSCRYQSPCKPNEVAAEPLDLSVLKTLRSGQSTDEPQKRDGRATVNEQENAGRYPTRFAAASLCHLKASTQKLLLLLISVSQRKAAARRGGLFVRTTSWAVTWGPTATLLVKAVDTQEGVCNGARCR